MFGSHLSIAGGLHNALVEAKKLGMATVQIFTRNQHRWTSKPLSRLAIKQWHAHCRRLRFRQTVSHDSYLINLASPDDMLWHRSISLFVEELCRCQVLGIPWLVTHPGSHMGAGQDQGLRRVAAALDRICQLADGCKVITCLETTAGQGSSLGWRLEHLAWILDKVKHPDRIAICLDTAHLFAAGYDFRGRRYPRFISELDRLLGLRLVKVIHLNDSRKGLGSRIDRHEHIGRGRIGLEGFRPWVRDSRFAQIPKILETPKGKTSRGRDWDQINLERLCRLM